MRKQEYEPIDYEVAFRDLMAKRRRQRIAGPLKGFDFQRLDLRPTSPGQVLAVGAVLAVVGWLVPAAQLAVTAGLALLVVGFITSLMRPRARHVYWRQREIELPADETWATRLYRLIYRSA